MPLSTGYPNVWCPRVKSFFAYNPETHERRIYPIRCKCWTCPYCFRKNLRNLLRRLRNSKPERFITLTAKRKNLETPIQCYHRHRPLIRRLFALIRRKFGPTEYAVVCEPHRNGFPHWHILQRGAFVPQRWLSSTWERLTGAKIVDIRRCDKTGDACRYVTKYITKAMVFRRLDARFRIITFSKRYLFREQTKCLRHPWTGWRELYHPLALAGEYSAACVVTWMGDYFAVDVISGANTPSNAQLSKCRPIGDQVDDGANSGAPRAPP